MATPIKFLFPPIEKKPFLLNKQKAGAVARRRVSTGNVREERPGGRRLQEKGEGFLGLGFLCFFSKCAKLPSLSFVCVEGYYL